MEKKNSFWNVLVCAAEAVLGILLLTNPEGFTKSVIICFGVLCLLYAIVNIISYFKMTALEAAASQSLFKGLVGAAAGLFCVTHSDWFILTFPYFIVIYGIGILALGFLKIQAAVDLIRFKQNYWQIVALSAALSLIFAFIIFIDPFASTAALWIFVGVTLIVSAVIDIIGIFIDAIWERQKGKKDKKQKEDKKEEKAEDKKEKE